MDVPVTDSTSFVFWGYMSLLLFLAFSIVVAEDKNGTISKVLELFKSLLELLKSILKK